MRSYVGILSMVSAYTLMYILARIVQSIPFEESEAFLLCIPWLLLGGMCVLWFRVGQQRRTLNNNMHTSGEKATRSRIEGR